MSIPRMILCLVLATTGCEKLRRVEGRAPVTEADAKAASMSGQAQGRGMVAVQRKRAHLLRDTLAKALVLHPQGLCLELGRYPCADTVHLVSLGGAAAYTNSQYHYPEDVSITSPTSFDRLVLSACLQRAQIDLSNTKQAVIFKDIELTVDGRLVDGEPIRAALDLLYQRGLQRHATEEEINALRGLYEKVYEAEPVGAARNWMVLACFSVIGSVESAFY